MRPVKGFALLLALLLVFLLTVFACAMLLLAQDHYGSSRMLHDSENARTVCESVGYRLVRQHNFDTPRFFLDPLAWDGLRMKPLVWNGYGIQGTLSEPWNSTDINLLRIKVQRARSLASLEIPVEQIRF